MSLQSKQLEFMQSCGQPTFTLEQSAYDDVLDFESPVGQQTALWWKLIKEEFIELADAVGDFSYPSHSGDNLVNLRDVVSEAVDLVYVTMGLMNALGLPFDEVFAAIHQANMNKCVDGQVIRRADGKILKPDGWKPANVLDLLKKHLES